ncbi:hypothetical protein [Oryzibacter oryziterrae]|uniref:hypothetical protein n=1 Tax=Oryzibacter oryziterrae TaxID=2766474 RepID=UPI001F2A6A86|nr:hypothetical protein [Oryzibacter oryziterrae]
MKIISRAKKNHKNNTGAQIIPDLLTSFEGIEIIDDEFSIKYASYIICKVFGEVAFNAVQPLVSEKSGSVYIISGQKNWSHIDAGKYFEGKILIKISAINGEILDVRYETQQIFPNTIDK